MKKAFLLILLLFAIRLAWSQEPAVQETIENLVESLGDELDENTDIQEIIDDLTWFSQNPLAINLATKEEFQRLHLLTDAQIDDLLAYRKSTGQIFSLYEMASIKGFHPELLRKIEPFISFENQPSNPKFKRPENTLFLRAGRGFTTEEGGLKDPKFEGSMERYYLRFKHVSTSIEYGMITEKDPGEAFFSGANKYGFDYAGGFLNFKTSASGSRVFVGDYRVSFGQGLVAWQGFSMGKSSETTQVFRSAQGIRSNSSTDENLFFRGIATQLKFGDFTFSPFASFRTLDASIDTIDGNRFFGAFQSSGYHRTTSEIAGKNSLNQITGGGNISFNWQSWSFGVTAVHTTFNAEMDRSDEPYNQFLWEGKRNFVTGFDWKGTVRNVFVFGEAAASANKGRAFITGLSFKPAANAEFTTVYRNINKTYFSFYSGAFTESSRANDEQGLYLGLKLFPAARWTFSTYADFFNHRWVKYTTAAPSHGAEFMAQLAFRPSRSTELYLRFFQEEKEQKVVSENNKYNQPQRINRLRLNFGHELNQNFSIKTRIETSGYSKLTEEQGFIILQDFNYKPLEKNFALNGRFSWFKTDGYNSRLYAYENDVLYAFSIPALYGKGIRTYLNFRQNFTEKLTLWLKVAATHRFSEVEGENTTEAITKSELKVQLRYQF
jgi:hypothetical protein